MDSKWILFGLLSGGNVNLNLGAVLAKRISLISTTLKTRSEEYKADLVEDFKKTALKGFDEGSLKPIIFKTYPFDWSNV